MSGAEALPAALAGAAGSQTIESRAVLDSLPIAIYTTDADGWITYWNQACVDFAGREPQLGEDRWCVTWRLFTQEGESLPTMSAPWLRQSRKDGR